MKKLLLIMLALLLASCVAHNPYTGTRYSAGYDDEKGIYTSVKLFDSGSISSLVYGWFEGDEEVNEEEEEEMTDSNIFHSAVRRQVLLERLKSSETQEFLKAFKEVEKLLRSSFAELDSDLIELRIKDLNHFIAQLNGEMRDIYQPYKDRYYEELRELAEVTAKTTGKDLYKDINKAATISQLAEGVAASKAFNTPMTPNGKLLKPFFDKMTNQEVIRVTDEVRKGYYQGRTNADMIRSLIGTKSRNYKDGVLNISRRNATALIKTATQHSASLARIETFKQNADIVTGYKIIATLDSKTSSQCRALDNQSFEYGKGPVTPIHIACRSTMVPELDEEFKFLSEGSTRSSDDGPISSTNSYYDWLKTQPESIQREVLGRERYNLFNSKNMTAEKFRKLQLDKNFEPLNLSEIKSLEPDLFTEKEKRITFKERIKDIRAAASGTNEKRLIDSIKLPSGLRGNIKISNVTPAARKSVNQATEFLNDFYPQEVSDLISKGIAKVRKSKGRGYYTPHNKNLVVNGSATNAIHEMSHAIEFESSKIAKASNDFLIKRANQERPQRLRDLTGFNYAYNEIAFKDKWEEKGGSVYMGKVYKGVATEIITMGMERMFKEPLKFAKEDPEYFEFLIKTLQHSNEL